RGKAAARAERARAFRQAADEALRRNDTAAAFWLLLETAHLNAETRDRQAALRTLDEAQALAGEEHVARIQALEARSRVLQALGSPRESEAALQDALRRRRTSRGPEGRSAAAELESLGALGWVITDLPAAERNYSQALRIREERAPGTLVHARSLRQMANVRWARGDYAEAETLARRSLAIAEAREPGGRTAANAVNMQGN